MTTKTYSTRDSATSALRKLGLQARDYDLFIKKVDGKFETQLGKAAAHLESLKNPAPVAKKIAKAAQVLAETGTTEQEHAEHRGEVTVKTPRTGVSAVARGLIATGKTNAEVWAVLQEQFSLDDSKKHYPSWYRSEMKRAGQL